MKPDKHTSYTPVHNFVRVRRHKAKIVYVVHTCLPTDNDDGSFATVVTNQSGKALTLLGKACLDARNSSRQPYLTAHVEYGFNKHANHPKPDNFHSDFSLAEFAAHHFDWKKEVTEYAIPTAEETL